jgi:hypothetical protein
MYLNMYVHYLNNMLYHLHHGLVVGPYLHTVVVVTIYPLAHR